MSGKLNLELTFDYFARLLEDRDCISGAIEVVDFTEVTDLKLEYGEMASITDNYQGIKASRDIRATLFHCPTDLSFGIARMLQTLHSITNKDHVVLITRN